MQKPYRFFRKKRSPVPGQDQIADVTASLFEISKKLTAIESLLRRLPEIQAAVFIQMWDEYQAARIVGVKPSELWDVIPPNQR